MKVETWKTISPETAYVITSLDAFAMVFMVIILLALAFGIVNTMLMAVLERRRELGMLMAVGMSKTRVFFMVLWETILLSVVGMPIGLLAAWFSVKLLAKTGIDMSAYDGR
ncbi:MAG: FtsX-like permease family protein [Saprospiraceae bacterium]